MHATACTARQLRAMLASDKDSYQQDGTEDITVATVQLNRTTFATSRLMEFFTEKELSMQIGHARSWWPIALVKELIDNALDACESAAIPPDITVAVEADAVIVRDNGPGLQVSSLERARDYDVRASDKAWSA